MRIPFNRATLTGNELLYVAEAVREGHISGDGKFTRMCSEFFENRFGVPKVLLTPSCTAALEMAAILLQLGEGDEFILPSFAFVSTANTFVLRGARPVFVDIRPDTLNINEEKIEERIGKRTRAIVLIHYAGVACEMDTILSIAQKYSLPVIEDAAQAVNARYKGRYLGTLGELGAYSFHETKNYTCGEGGALLVNNRNLVERAEIVRQKGTNRNQFFRGLVEKYTWTDIGSSFVLSDLLAAFLYAQLEKLDEIHERRKQIYAAYQHAFEYAAGKGKVILPVIPRDCDSNHHLFHILLESQRIRDRVIEGLKQKGILSVFHYVPLHLSPMGERLGYRQGDLPVTEDLSARLLRLPFYHTLTEEEILETVREVEALI